MASLVSNLKAALTLVSCVVLLSCVVLFSLVGLLSRNFPSPLFTLNTTLPNSVPRSETSPFALSVIDHHHKSWRNTSETVKPITNRRGYVLALSYWDQQTSALRNLLGLQCWATKVNLKVVEPFVVGSDYGMQVVKQNNDSDEMEVRFRDLFDIDQWNGQYHTKLTPLVSWKSFLENAPRNIILVEIKYTDHPMKFPELPLDVACNKKRLTQQFLRYFGSHQFHLQRTVCLDFKKLGILTTSQFNAYLFGNFSTSSVSVVFTEWRGIATSVYHRIMLRDFVCDSRLGVALGLNPSQKIFKHANQYIQRYLHGGDYVAIALRLERMFSPAGKVNVSACLNKTLGYLSRLKQRIHPANTFLSIDAGRFGSKGYKKKPLMASTLTLQVEKLIETLYGNSTTIEDWEETFVNISRTSNPGYIALLQKTIATRAKCLLLVGGGTFQQHASMLYQRMHTSRQCYIQLDGFCSQKVYKVPWQFIRLQSDI